MDRLRPLLSLIVAVGLGSLASLQPAWPGMYQCKEPNGAMVFTDRTAQLQHCQAMNTDTTPRRAYPVGAADAPIAGPAAPEPDSVGDQSDVPVQPVPVPPAEDEAVHLAEPQNEGSSP